MQKLTVAVMEDDDADDAADTVCEKAGKSHETIREKSNLLLVATQQ